MNRIPQATTNEILRALIGGVIVTAILLVL
jgi:hypothetical protein